MKALITIILLVVIVSLTSFVIIKSNRSIEFNSPKEAFIHLVKAMRSPKVNANKVDFEVYFENPVVARHILHNRDFDPTKRSHRALMGLVFITGSSGENDNSSADDERLEAIMATLKIEEEKTNNVGLIYILGESLYYIKIKNTWLIYLPDDKPETDKFDKSIE